MRVAYLSSDFGVHATALLAAGLFEHHDRSRFEVTALAWDCDDSPMRRRLEPAFDRFVDIGAMPDAAVAQLIREREIDIAVDLKGFTRGHRCRILAGRPAPIQVGYLGYPGTMGAAWIDYLIADRFVAPPEAAQCYSEKLVYLPDCYQVNDDKRAAAGERAGARRGWAPGAGVRVRLLQQYLQDHAGPVRDLDAPSEAGARQRVVAAAAAR